VKELEHLYLVQLDESVLQLVLGVEAEVVFGQLIS
jgi:hypothetical protein